jgi:16S rRNA (guanine1516-N2)-methyltransferase
MNLAVIAVTEQWAQQAAGLALRLGLRLLPPDTELARCTEAEAVLLVGDEGLALQQTGRGAPGPVRVDFGGAQMRHRRRGGHNELLGRAVGIGKKASLAVVDATAGLGRDSLVLADLGCRLILCERHPVVAALLRSGLDSALASDDDWLRAVAQKMTLFPDAAQRLAPATVATADAIYLDPMFPARRKNAAVKKDMRLFQALLGQATSDGGEQLLDWALAQEVARVVVKRPAKAGALGGRAPSHAITGTAVRFDVHVLRALGPG